MADPICRWRNSSIKQVLEFNDVLPLNPCSKIEGRNYVERYWNMLGGSDFFTTAYQLAAQMGMYYEDTNSFYPRFSTRITIDEAFGYINEWGKKYYAPNPYTRSMNSGQKPVIINNFLVNWTIEHENPKFSDALKDMFVDSIGNTDILINMLNNFSDVTISEDKLSLKSGVAPIKREVVSLDDVDVNDKKFFFEYFGGIISSTGYKEEKTLLFENSNIATFMGLCVSEFLSFDKNIQRVSSSIKVNNVTIGFKKCPFGKSVSSEQSVTDLRRSDDCDKNIIWSYEDEDYYFYKEQTGASLAIFADCMNKIYGDVYLIELDGTIYRLYKKTKTTFVNTDLPLQQIYYGAPGTGKSFGVDEVIKKNHYKAVRTTFHPDSDYSTFVGCYKPQMETVTVRDDRGFPVKENGQVVCKKEIVYKYSPQAFLKAYVEAWKDTNSPQVLVIEEINRGNCAQIFGDIFQLLDRNKFGYSSYPIIADQDIMMHLNEKFSGLNIANADEIDAMYEEAVTEDVLNGSKLILPKNLYIWATMNTSDQSLFPIDSAFKRRWDWKYVRISEGRDKNTGALIKNTIKIDDSHSYDWWEFLEAINNAIGDATNSEDKKLGFFFCKAKDNVIDAELFVAKVIFYLWNDVFKDSDTDLFQVLEDGNQPTFDQFYTEDTMGNTIVNTNVVVKFIEKVMKGVE